MRTTSVNIEKEKESNIPEEVLLALDNLVKLSVEYEVPRRVIYDLIRDKRRDLEYEESVEALPEESEEVKAFRAKLEKFFTNLEVFPADLRQFIWDYELWFSNYHIEVPVAAYQIYLEGGDLLEENIFQKARVKMKPTDEYYKLKKKKYTGSWRTSKMMNIRRLQVYFNHLCDIRLKKFYLEKEFEEFIADKKIYRVSLPWIKLIFLVENFY